MVHLNCSLGEPDLGHSVQSALGLSAGHALQGAERLVQLDGPPLQAVQQGLLLLSIELVGGLAFLRTQGSNRSGMSISAQRRLI